MARICSWAVPERALHHTVQGLPRPGHPKGRPYAIAFRGVRLYLIGGSKIEKGNSGLLGLRPSRHRVSQGLVIPESSHLA